MRFGASRNYSSLWLVCRSRNTPTLHTPSSRRTRNTSNQSLPQDIGFRSYTMPRLSTSNTHPAFKVREQARSSLLRPNPKLDHALENSAARGLPRIDIGDLHGQFLSIQCHLMKAKSVLEIGTLGGYSSIWFASTGAKVTSIEIDPKHRDVALENTKGLDVEIILGAALDVLPKLAADEQKFDFIFIDADWAEQWEYFQWAVKLTNTNGCIYVDNVVKGILESDATGEGESLITKVGREAKVEATLISTMSAKRPMAEESFDGFLLAIVKGDK